MQETLRDSNTNSKGGKSSSKQGKGADSFSYEQVKQAQDEYNEEATLFVFRLKSLKQGQFRSLLTQATRHHAAQVSCSNLLSHVSVLYACVFWLWLYIMFLFVCKCPPASLIVPACCCGHAHGYMLVPADPCATLSISISVL